MSRRLWERIKRWLRSRSPIKEFRVTAHHMTIGHPESVDQCPLAMAIHEQLGYNTISIGQNGIMLDGYTPTVKLFEMDEALKKWVKDFDAMDKPMDEITVVLNRLSGRAYIIQVGDC